MHQAKAEAIWRPEAPASQRAGIYNSENFPIHILSPPLFIENLTFFRLDYSPMRV
jgi:hypothetical protein